ncbi:unnamed protein product [Bursaphelenchus okinawaensis]|uniref:Uncharacterized protein n=1 Tax=Bursaphelenchus okinawaensis TaxID=465554 RepID=A0A811JVI1_9BILA|nr:unnamed protein product [Bursaphelenchus okinawaensis]CAG9085902.1 unnamed protein product [Bursaphelenchus okinawaensis]
MSEATSDKAGLPEHSVEPSTSHANLERQPSSLTENDVIDVEGLGSSEENVYLTQPSTSNQSRRYQPSELASDLDTMPVLQRASDSEMNFQGMGRASGLESTSSTGHTNSIGRTNSTVRTSSIGSTTQHHNILARSHDSEEPQIYRPIPQRLQNGYLPSQLYKGTLVHKTSFDMPYSSAGTSTVTEDRIFNFLANEVRAKTSSIEEPTVVDHDDITVENSKVSTGNQASHGSKASLANSTEFPTPNHSMLNSTDFLTSHSLTNPCQTLMTPSEALRSSTEILAQISSLQNMAPTASSLHNIMSTASSLQNINPTSAVLQNILSATSSETPTTNVLAGVISQAKDQLLASEPLTKNLLQKLNVFHMFHPYSTDDLIKIRSIFGNNFDKWLCLYKEIQSMLTKSDANLLAVLQHYFQAKDSVENDPLLSAGDSFLSTTPGFLGGSQLEPAKKGPGRPRRSTNPDIMQRRMSVFSSENQVPEPNEPIQTLTNFFMKYNVSLDVEFSRKALESLMKKLKEKPEEVKALIDVVRSAGLCHSPCITIMKTLDGRLQVAGRKGFPHIIYGRIFRWPGLKKNESSPLEVHNNCRHIPQPTSGVGSDGPRKDDTVCVNPWHYQKHEDPLGTEKARRQPAPRHHHQQALPSDPPDPIHNKKKSRASESALDEHYPIKARDETVHDGLASSSNSKGLANSRPGQRGRPPHTSTSRSASYQNPNSREEAMQQIAKLQMSAPNSQEVLQSLQQRQAQMATLAQDSGILAQDSGILTRDSGILARDSGILARDSGILAQDSGILAQDSGILTQDSGIPLPSTIETGQMLKNREKMAESPGYMTDLSPMSRKRIGSTSRSRKSTETNSPTSTEPSPFRSRQNSNASVSSGLARKTSRRSIESSTSPSPRKVSRLEDGTRRSMNFMTNDGFKTPHVYSNNEVPGTPKKYSSLLSSPLSQTMLQSPLHSLASPQTPCSLDIPPSPTQQLVQELMLQAYRNAKAMTKKEHDEKHLKRTGSVDRALELINKMTAAGAGSHKMNQFVVPVYDRPVKPDPLHSDVTKPPLKNWVQNYALKQQSDSLAKFDYSDMLKTSSVQSGLGYGLNQKVDGGEQGLKEDGGNDVEQHKQSFQVAESFKNLQLNLEAQSLEGHQNLKDQQNPQKNLEVHQNPQHDLEVQTNLEAHHNHHQNLEVQQNPQRSSEANRNLEANQNPEAQQNPHQNLDAQESLESHKNPQSTSETLQDLQLNIDTQLNQGEDSLQTQNKRMLQNLKLKLEALQNSQVIQNPQVAQSYQFNYATTCHPYIKFQNPINPNYFLPTLTSSGCSYSEPSKTEMNYNFCKFMSETGGVSEAKLDGFELGSLYEGGDLMTPSQREAVRQYLITVAAQNKNFSSLGQKSLSALGNKAYSTLSHKAYSALSNKTYPTITSTLPSTTNDLTIRNNDLTLRNNDLTSLSSSFTNLCNDLTTRETNDDMPVLQRAENEDFVLDEEDRKKADNYAQLMFDQVVKTAKIDASTSGSLTAAAEFMVNPYLYGGQPLSLGEESLGLVDEASGLRDEALKLVEEASRLTEEPLRLGEEASSLHDDFLSKELPLIETNNEGQNDGEEGFKDQEKLTESDLAEGEDEVEDVEVDTVDVVESGRAVQGQDIVEGQGYVDEESFKKLGLETASAIPSHEHVQSHEQAFKKLGLDQTPAAIPSQELLAEQSFQNLGLDQERLTTKRKADWSLHLLEALKATHKQLASSTLAETEKCLLDPKLQKPISIDQSTNNKGQSLQNIVDQPRQDPYLIIRTSFNMEMNVNRLQQKLDITTCSLDTFCRLFPITAVALLDMLTDVCTTVAVRVNEEELSKNPILQVPCALSPTKRVVDIVKKLESRSTQLVRSPERLLIASQYSDKHSISRDLKNMIHEAKMMTAEASEVVITRISKFAENLGTHGIDRTVKDLLSVMFKGQVEPYTVPNIYSSSSVDLSSTIQYYENGEAKGDSFYSRQPTVGIGTLPPNLTLPTVFKFQEIEDGLEHARQVVQLNKDKISDGFTVRTDPNGDMFVRNVSHRPLYVETKLGNRKDTIVTPKRERISRGQKLKVYDFKNNFKEICFWAANNDKHMTHNVKPDVSQEMVMNRLRAAGTIRCSYDGRFKQQMASFLDMNRGIEVYTNRALTAAQEMYEKPKKARYYLRYGHLPGYGCAEDMPRMHRRTV